MRELLGMAAVAAVLASAGCASYASLRLAPDAAAARKAEIFGDIEQREFGKSVQVKLPSELVVAEVRTSVSGAHQNRSDKRSVQLSEALAEDRATFSNVSPLFVDSWTAKYADLRSAAARHRADLMVVTTMTEGVRSENGVLPLLNLLILPCFVVPTQTNDLELHVRAAVIDVRNDLVYATFEDHREERIHATVSGEKDAIEEGFDRLYADSLAKLRSRVAERLRQLEAAP